jgi:hypothetical protein
MFWNLHYRVTGPVPVQSETWHCFWQRSSWGWQVGGDLRQNPYPCPKPINSERVTPPVTLLCRRNQINHNRTRTDWRHAKLRVKIFPKFTHFSDNLLGGGGCWDTRNDCRDTRNFWLMSLERRVKCIVRGCKQNDKPYPKLVSALKSWQLFNRSRNTPLEIYEIRMLIVVLTGQHPKPPDSFISSRCVHFPQHLSCNPFFFSGKVLHLHKTTSKITV